MPKQLEINLISKEEALKILEISEESLDNLVSQGVIYPIYAYGDQMFSLEDVVLLKNKLKVYKGKGVDLVQLLNRLEYLEKKLATIESQMEILLGFFGLSQKQLGKTAIDNLEEILRQLSKAAYTSNVRKEELDYLLDILYSFNRAHLNIMKTYLNVESPATYILEMLSLIEAKFLDDIGYLTKISLLKAHFKPYYNEEVEEEKAKNNYKEDLNALDTQTI